MSRENLYDLRKQYRESARKTEREYSKAVTEPMMRELNRAELRLSRGVQGLLTGGLSGMREGFMRPEEMQAMQTTEPAVVSRPSVLGMNMRDPTQPPKDIVISPEFQNAALDMATNPANYLGMGMLKSFGRAMPQNVRTQFDDFYSGNPLKKLRGAAKAGIQAVPYALEEALSPTARATAEKFGAGMGRRAEILNPIDEKGVQKPSIRQGNLVASPQLRMQRDARTEITDTVSEAMPTFRSEVFATGNIADDVALKKVLAADEDIPDDVMSDAVNHVRAVQSSSGIFQARRKAAAGSNLGAEAAGTAKGTAPMVAKVLSNPKILEEFKKYAGDELNEKEMREYLGVINAITGPAARTRLGKNKLSSGFYQGEEGKSLKSTYLVETYWKAKAKQKAGKKLTDIQKEALSFVNKHMAENPVRIRTTESGNLVLQQSFRSSAKDLGGMNIFAVVNPKSQEFYTMMTDGSDIFGLTPPGWSDLTTVLPIQRRRIGDQSDPRGSMDINEAAIAAREAAVSDLERVSGMTRMRGESIKAFEDRVARYFVASPSDRDRTIARSNQAGLFFGSIQGENNEEQR
jgi:hypothetical protein